MSRGGVNPNRSNPCVKLPLPPIIARTIRRKLLAWYDRNRRDLPWRRESGNAYAQWVAEIMLQQTRVETVVPYYQRFMERFPTVTALADARHETVLKHWEGLGYYRRALNLHRAAKEVRDRHGGIMPLGAEALKALPGIGEYTAAAIASIASDEPVAAVDGNVARVLSRMFGVTLDVASSAGKRRLRDIAGTLLPRRRCGDFNQGWMDLGSLVCTPKAPKCPQCPLVSLCAAAPGAGWTMLPVRDSMRRRTVKEVACLAAVLVHEGRLLVRRRPRGGLWSGLWEFPTIEVSGRRGLLARLDALAEEEGLRVVAHETEAQPVLHRLTHRALTFHVATVACRPVNGHVGDPARRWVTREGFERLSVSTAHRKIYRAASGKVDGLLPRGRRKRVRRANRC